MCVLRLSSYIEDRRAREKGERERWLLTMLDKRERIGIVFSFSYRRTDSTRVQTSTIFYVLRNSVRRVGSRERRERIGIVFCFSYRRTDSTAVQTSTISYVLHNSVRLGGSQERGQRIDIVFCFSYRHTATTRVLGNSSVILIVVRMFLVK